MLPLLYQRILEIILFVSRCFMCDVSFVARSCEYDPPETFLGIDVDWPQRSRLSGTRVTYTCPFKKITDVELLTGTFKQCSIFPTSNT